MSKAGSSSNPKKRKIHSQAYFEGLVNTQGGDIVIGDKIVYSQSEFIETQNALQLSIEKLRNAQLRLLRDSSRLPEQPYLHLYPFDLGQRSVFYGRAAAQQALLEKIQQSRLTLLHAPSGAGKTSLLRAGVQAALIEADHLPIYLPRPSRPVHAIRQFILPKPPYPDRFALWPLNTLLAWACQHLGNPQSWLVIIIDQFEEFFIQTSPEDQQDFVRSMAECLENPALEQARFVLAMRKDYFSDMSMFNGSIPQIFQNDYRLLALVRAEARQAIEAPLAGRVIRWADGAVDELLAYLERGEIETPHLQLICSRLYNKAQEANQSEIQVSGLDLQAIHAGYLEEEMAALAPPAFSLVQKELAWKLLKRLITSHGTKQAVPLEAIEQLALPDEFEPLLAHLVDRRLLRRDEDPLSGQATVEVAHDTLAAIILEKDPEERRRKTAEELIGRGLQDWIYHKMLMDPARLHILDDYQDVLKQIFDDRAISLAWKLAALEYLLRSSLVAVQGVVAWYHLAQDKGLDAAVILQERLQSQNFRERTVVVQVLSSLGAAFIPTARKMLQDEYPQVRAAAIAALERLQPTGEWRRHLKYECYVPAGEFMMGAGSSAHAVHLNAFYIAKYPVTNVEYGRYKENVGQPFELPHGKEQHPVVSVTWYDACDYATWAGMRLLTEAEWEKAASWHKGEKRQYPWGYSFDKARCNTSQAGTHTTTPVGQYSPQGDSPYGVADMIGNACEWCSSLKKEYPYQDDDGRENPAAGGLRVLRGSSFDGNISSARCSYRSGSLPHLRYDRNGFRVGISFSSPADDS